GSDFCGVIHQQSIELIDADAMILFDDPPDEADPFAHRKERLLVGIQQNGNHELIHELQRALNEVEMAVRNGVKRAWIYRDLLHVPPIVQQEARMFALPKLFCYIDDSPPVILYEISGPERYSFES